MKKKIAIAMGGYSKEYKISLKSGAQIYKHIDREKFEVYKVYILENNWFVQLANGEKYPIDKGNFSVMYQETPLQFDAVFNIIHGTPGEDGLFQAYLQTLGIPQTASDYYEAALTFNKRDCLSVVSDYGIQTAVNYPLQKSNPIDEEAIIKKVGLPCFVKANRGGSSFGISKVKEKSALKKAIALSFEQDDQIIIESFLEGTEVSVGIINFRGHTKVLPVTEIVSENEFFDYHAKYLGQSREITPARISEQQTQVVCQQTENIFRLLHLKGFARAEFIFHRGIPHFLEINTCPGMTAASIVPQQIEASGISQKAFYTDLLENAIDAFA